MKKLRLKLGALAAAGIIAGMSLTATAAPAYPGLVKVTRPDGTTLSIRAVGDEFGHMVVTEDGYPLLLDEQLGYVYASVQADGTLASSGIRANDISAREAGEISFLNGISSERINLAYTALADRAAKSPKRMKSPATRAAQDPRQIRGLCETTFPMVKGEQKGLVILVEYSDLPFGKYNDPDYSYKEYNGDANAYFTDLLNKEGFNANGITGSAREWFMENSVDETGKAQFIPSFDLYGPVKLPRTMSYYGKNESNGDEKNPWKMVTDAIEILSQDPEFDLSKYDLDKDGVCDNVFIIYAGYGESTHPNVGSCVWPHSYDVRMCDSKPYRYNNTIIGHYACANETDENLHACGIATFLHEFSHVMGLPDLYVTNGYYSAETPHEFSILDTGCYNNNSKTPPNYSAYERYALGWIEPEEFPKSADITLAPIHEAGKAYIVKTNRENEYYLVENRQPWKWDEYLPAHGMMIWHVDYDRTIFEANRVNNDDTHQYVDIVEAIGQTGPSYYKGYPFPGSANVTSYRFKSWANADTGVSITGIGESGSRAAYSSIAFHAENPTGVDVSGVDAIESAEEAEAEYFNLQGMRVTEPAKGQLLIRKAGGNATKIIF